ncbi:LCP family protein [Halobacillus salinarum]|uniref:LCP family protein n=1 Tax=Halobacillus salinarum TaxID=2932257 RepID=A0ABY4EP22_9BACI|nr:LCP family protein [Halobacillus salinarum]UOQ45687.1 LCP family protein [Halobacillus salinarum]
MRHKWKFIITAIGILFLFGAGSALGYTAFLTNKAEKVTKQSQMELERGERSEKRENIVNPEVDNTSILFVGIDSSEKRNSDGEANSRSDALVLATFNNDKESVKMLNIPRDSYVYIPEVGYKDKITHAHAFGGINATVNTVETMLDVPVDYYVRLDFNSFVDVVNALGGIEFNVPFRMEEQNSRDKKDTIVLDQGKQTLNGEEALALARTRKYDSDLARGQRQMELIQAIVKKASSLHSIGNYGEVIDSLGKHMKTNLSFEQLTTFKDYVVHKEAVEFETMQLEGEPQTINGVWYYSVDHTSLEKSKYSLKHHLGINVSNQTEMADDTEKDASDSM